MLVQLVVATLLHLVHADVYVTRINGVTQSFQAGGELFAYGSRNTDNNYCSFGLHFVSEVFFHRTELDGNKPLLVEGVVTNANVDVHGAVFLEDGTQVNMTTSNAYVNMGTKRPSSARESYSYAITLLFPEMSVPNKTALATLQVSQQGRDEHFYTCFHCVHLVVVNSSFVATDNTETLGHVREDLNNTSHEDFNNTEFVVRRYQSPVVRAVNKDKVVAATCLVFGSLLFAIMVRYALCRHGNVGKQ